MTLQPGTWLNHYQILGHLGTGGMGEVYRALDNKLQREVALKVLPKAFAQDPERLARFRREAQVLAQLNHVNIAAIYNLEQSGETHFLVMELALGETLRDRINPSRAREQAAYPSPVPLEEALEISKQIAAGLECAHEKPIVHRDLKPANIKVSSEGVVKILDFGLARAFAGDNASSDPADSPTLSAMTAPGTILGTAAYMSPEQARGKKVDKRTDIWALGCVLYELLTGKQAFDPSRDRVGAGGPLRANGQPPVADAKRHMDVVSGSDEHTIADIIGAVLYKEPDWTALPAPTPHWVRVLLRRCLEKDAKRRLSSAADLQIQIDEALTAPATAAPLAAPQVPPQPFWRRAVPLHVAALVAIVALISVGLAVWNLRQPTPRPIERLVVPLAAEERLPNLGFPVLALSPDGAQLAYKTTRGIYVRAMDSFEARLLPGTERANDLFFSPDGQWIGFFAGGKLKKVSVSGGATLTLSDAPNHRGASWGPNDTIVFAPVNNVGLSRVSAGGGAPQELTKLKEGETSHRWPQFLPDGKTILFTTIFRIDSDEAQIAAQRLDTGERKILIRGGAYARYVPTGHLVYYRAGTLMAVPFNPARLEVTGTPAPVLENVMSSTGGTNVGQFSFSSTGSLVYIPGTAQAAEFSLTWVDRKGAETPLPAPPRAYDDPLLSPDGQQVAVQIPEATSEIWTYDLSRSTLTRLTFVGTANFPLWTPDGKRIAYRTNVGGREPGLYWKPADGTGSDESLLSSQSAFYDVSISPHGKALAYAGIEAVGTTAGDIWILPLEGDPRQAGAEGRKSKPFLQAPSDQSSPMFSPDGRWIAYVSNESGRSEVYVQPYPGPGGKWQISTDGGLQPVWARNGRELFYLNGAKMMAVEIATQPTFRPGAPRMLFERPELQSGAQPGARADYDVSPDGQRFLMLKAREQQQQSLSQINVVLNWFEELKRRVPVP